MKIEYCVFEVYTLKLHLLVILQTTLARDTTVIERSWPRFIEILIILEFTFSPFPSRCDVISNNSLASAVL